MDIIELEKKKKAQINGIFILMIEMVFIFGLPAVGAITFGKYLDGGEAKLYTALLLALALIISWTVVILLYKKKTKDLARVESQIKELKK